MSADNFVLVDRKTLKVYEGCASTNHTTEIGQGKTLEEAIDIATSYVKRNIVEYGIHFR